MHHFDGLLTTEDVRPVSLAVEARSLIGRKPVLLSYLIDSLGRLTRQLVKLLTLVAEPFFQPLGSQVVTGEPLVQPFVQRRHGLGTTGLMRLDELLPPLLRLRRTQTTVQRPLLGNRTDLIRRRTRPPRRNHAIGPHSPRPRSPSIIQQTLQPLNTHIITGEPLIQPLVQRRHGLGTTGLMRLDELLPPLLRLRRT
ncbi:hypothetical protein, partial [Actinoallomurus sp. NPDC052274]|uniref:hypothetical protein n=1 Tax=Actinoallomurus sp. NPDC052274 TaxID=3155420 RepID=UPI00342B4B40